MLNMNNIKRVLPLSCSIYLYDKRHKKNIKVNVYLGEREISFISEKDIVYKIKYEEIKGSVIDGNNVYIYLNIKIINDFVITNKNGFHTIKVTLSNPFLLTQELKFCYNYYYLMNCSKVKELSIKVKNIKKIKKKQYYDIEIPEGFILSTSIQGYKCLLPSNSIITESNNNRIKFRIKDIKGGVVVNELQFMRNLNNYSIEQISMNHLLQELRKVLVLNNDYLLSIMVSSNYIKKMNINDDISQFSGYYYTVYCHSLNHKISYNMMFIYLFRTFIYPSFDTYQSFFFNVECPTSTDFSDERYCKQILETVADSLYDSKMNYHRADIDYKILSATLLSMLTTYDEFEFYIHNLLPYSNEDKEITILLQNVVIYIIKIYSLLSISNCEPIESILKERLLSYDKNTKYDLIKTYSFDSIINMIFFGSFLSKGNTNYTEESKSIYINKIYRFIGYCINNSLFPDLINYDLILNYGINSKDLRKEFMKILHLCIAVNHIEVVYYKEDNKNYIDTILSYWNSNTNNKSIYIDYNREFMCSIIKSGYFIKLFNISEAQFALFIKILFQTNSFNISIIRSLDSFLFRLILDSEKTLKEQMRITIPYLISMYKNWNIDIILSIEACNCLCDITSTDDDHLNKKEIIDQEGIDIILSLFDKRNNIYIENLFQISLMLLNNLISELSYEDIEQLINIEVFIDLISKYNYKTNKIKRSIYIIIAHLVKQEPSLLREKFFYDVNKTKLISFFDSIIGQLSFDNTEDNNKEDLILYKVSIFQLLSIFLQNSKNIHNIMIFDFLFDKEKLKLIINNISFSLYIFIQKILRRDDLLLEQYIRDLHKKYYEHYLLFIIELFHSFEDLINDYKTEYIPSELTEVLLLVFDNQSYQNELSFCFKQVIYLLSLLQKIKNP